MKRIKRIPVLFALLLAAAMLCGLLTGCVENSAAGTDTRPSLEGKTLSVVTTVFPIYDWTRQIIGGQDELVGLTLLLDKGADLHSYQPTMQDVYTISTCDVFIYIGGESDRWVDDALKQATNQDMTVICLLDLLGDAAKEEQALEGMEEEEEEEDGPAYDEHVWLSLRNAQTLCSGICDALCRKDPDHSADYTANLKAYNAQLAELDQAYTAAVEAAPLRTLLFADRFPFRYLAEDYGLTCYAAFSGCSTESEASFETVNFLVNKVDELGLPCVLTLEHGDQRLAQTVISNSKSGNAVILELNSLQSVTSEGVSEGITYLGVMQSDLEVLRQALGG
jgi:zinc transport system substrate-binding protein